MLKKSFVVLGALAFATVGAYAQRSLKLTKVTEKMTGGVSSAFSAQAPLSFVDATVINHRIAAAKFAGTNPVYVSSGNLLERVRQAQGLKSVPLAAQRKLTEQFSQLDVAVKTAQHRQNSYLGALRRMTPTTDPAVLADPDVKAMTELLDVQRYMQTHDNIFPQLFSLEKDGVLRVGAALENPSASQAFMGTLSILVKQSQGLMNPVIVEQLAVLRAHARNRADVEQLTKMLENWRLATGNLTGAPQLPAGMEGVSLRNNAESLWLATEIRLLQLTPDIELPEVLKTAQVVR